SPPGPSLGVYGRKKNDEDVPPAAWPLGEALAHDPIDIELVKFLYDHSPEFKAPFSSYSVSEIFKYSESKSTPGHISVIRVLAERDDFTPYLKKESPNSWKTSEADSFVRAGTVVFNIMLKHRLDSNLSASNLDHELAFEEAIQTSNPDIMERYLKAGFNPNYSRCRSRALLSQATIPTTQSEGVMRWLLTFC
ncbi:unnamed protein product, partial [Penicillium pancosmium]